MTKKTVATTSSIDGWTLIELIIVLTIIAVLALVTLPSISTLVKPSQRQLMQAELLRLAHQLEHNYNPIDGYTAIEVSFFPETKALYRVSLTIEDNGHKFRITAQPINEQADDGALLLDSEGNRRHYLDAEAGNNYVSW